MIYRQNGQVNILICMVEGDNGNYKLKINLLITWNLNIFFEMLGYFKVIFQNVWGVFSL